MLLKEIVGLLEASLVYGEQHLNKDIKKAFAADLMSDVLRLNTEDMILITGMANLQVLRTAEMSDICYILFVRNKKVTPEMLALARENGIAVLQCRQSMFKVCGELYKAGLEPVF
ncbi:DRTGG domain-containing protein [uncultured Odoribacter sp.]|uniref:DRTGG domain-containing protein n=1 Tax=uncultured Odoribacter sp. TaxID=876416 RepID=UPI002634C9CE|nr:DRTGG domain-containing protein [uncultured Odoribacter sp.]